MDGKYIISSNNFSFPSIPLSAEIENPVVVDSSGKVKYKIPDKP